MEEIGEKLSGNSQIQNLIEFSEFFKFSPIFRSKYFQICYESDKTTNTKAVALEFLYKFDIGKISSVVHVLRETMS